MENKTLLPYNEDEFKKISKQLRTNTVTKVIIIPSKLWVLTADRTILQQLERALFRVARNFGFTKVICEDTMSGMKKITFLKPSSMEYANADTY